MPRKPSPNIPTRSGADASAYHYYGSKGPSNALASQCLEESGAVFLAEARSRFADVEPGVSVREGMDQANWEFFRPGEHRPRRKNEVIRMSEHVYQNNGIVKFVVDMMADFVTQGVQVYHPAAGKQKRYRHWWKKVGGNFVSERLVNLLYRHGMAVVKRNFGVLNAGDLDDLERGVAAEDYRSAPADGLSDSVRESKQMIERDVKFPRSPKAARNRIPLKYTFINPVQVEVVGGEVSLFAGDPEYGLKIPETLVRAIKNAKTIEEKVIISNLPSYITNAIGGGKSLIPLDKDKVSVHFYKKDDWQLWAAPLTQSVMKDVLLYERMKDVDRAALDTMIRQIRLWKLGLPEHKIQPGKDAFRKLRDQLLAAQAGASVDMIWDAAITLECSSTDGYQWLGMEKYMPVLQAIYAGLGIPQSLTGGGGSGGMTNNALSLKTLIERLQYARNILIEFWEREFFLLQRAFGDRQPARLRFDMMTLSDEASEKMLWVQLWDRNLVTTETMREKFGLLQDVEQARLKREYKAADAGDAPHKIGPFTEAQPHPDQTLKAGMQVGLLSASEAGLKTKPKKKGDKSTLDVQSEQQDAQLDLQKDQMAHEQKLAEKQQKVDEQQGADLHQQKLQQNDQLHAQKLGQKDAEHKAALPLKADLMKEKARVQKAVIRTKGKQAIKQAKAKGQPGQGRPVNSKDTGTRKKRTPKVAAASDLFAAQVRAREAFRQITEHGTAAFLADAGKKNLRQLTSAQAEELERRKFAALCDVPPDREVNADVARALWDAASPAPPGAEAALAELVRANYGDRGVSPSIEDMREMYVSAYSIWHTNAGQETDGEA